MAISDSSDGPVILSGKSAVTVAGRRDDRGTHGDRMFDAGSLAANLLDTTPANQAVTYRNADKLQLATRAIHRNPTHTVPLPRSSNQLAALRYKHQGSDLTLDAWVAASRVSGLLVLKNGEIVHEQYAMGNTETTRWSNFSMAKSFTSTLVGAALADGAIGGLDDSVTRYVPELKGSAYQDNTIRECLQMTSGISWDEDNYTETINSDIGRYSKIMYRAEPGALMELVRSRPRAAKPGSIFHYSTADSYVLSAVVIGATGKTASDYLSERIWRPVGMEADAYWILDAPGGRELGGNGISATLRDFGRFGQFILTGGAGVLPEWWRDAAGSPHLPTTNFGRAYSNSLYGEDPLGYGYQWKAVPAGLAGAGVGMPTFMAIGLGGQYIYVNPAESIVVVLWSCWRNEQLPDVAYEYYALLDAVVKALH